MADAEAGFGGVLNAYELAKHLIEAGAAAVHFEDQLASAKKCGHLGGKVLVPTREGIAKLVAARLAGDVLNVPTILIARTDAEAADLITSDVDSRDKPFLTGARTAEGYYRTTPGIEQSISRALSYAPYCDMLWFVFCPCPCPLLPYHYPITHAPNITSVVPCPCFLGWKPRLPTLNMLANLLTLSTRSFLANFLHITALLHSTGRST